MASASCLLQQERAKPLPHLAQFALGGDPRGHCETLTVREAEDEADPIRSALQIESSASRLVRDRQVRRRRAAASRYRQRSRWRRSSHPPPRLRRRARCRSRSPRRPRAARRSAIRALPPSIPRAKTRKQGRGRSRSSRRRRPTKRSGARRTGRGTARSACPRSVASASIPSVGLSSSVIAAL